MDEKNSDFTINSCLGESMIRVEMNIASFSAIMKSRLISTDVRPPDSALHIKKKQEGTAAFSTLHHLRNTFYLN